MGMMIPNIFLIPCLKKAFISHVVVSMYVLLFHDESHLEFLPKACFYTWEEQLEGILLKRNLVLWKSISLEDATERRGEALQFYPCSFLRTSNIWEGRTLIFQNFPTINWNINFFLISPRRRINV